MSLLASPVAGAFATRGTRIASRASRPTIRTDGAILAVRPVNSRPAMSSTRASSSSSSSAENRRVGGADERPKGARAKRFRRRPPPVKCAEPGQVTAEADAETRTAVATHICADCGYLYVPSVSTTEKFADLRDDFTCPQCDAPKSRFATYDPVTGKASGKALKATIAEETETTQEDGEEEEAKKSNDASTDGPSAREIGTVAVFVALLGAAVGGAGGPTGAASEVTRAANLLVTNHLPGVGGVVEDSFLGLLTVCTVYCLWRSSVIPRPVGNPITRRSRTNASWVHVLSGAGALATGLYGVVLERVYRESPGWTWMWVSSALFLTNALTYGPLMQIFKASKEGKYAMKLGYSFVASFQGVVFIAWSAQPDAPDWMYWAVMPFWYFSIAKLWESTEFVLALAPEAPAGSFMDTVSAGSKQRLGQMTPDAATLTYVSLNAFAAIFDNCYMALYTALGPEQFWHTSAVFNDADFHLRLVKGTTGSLTVALLIFISTLGWRRQMSMDLAIWLNVILGSVGPWIVLFWHKLEDPSEMWFPQFVFDPAFDYHPLWQTASQILPGN